jgi:MFS family permease
MIQDGTTDANKTRLTLATLSLCTCSIVHAFVLISVYPYAALMAVDLLQGVTPETAGVYSGVLASSFMFGRTISSFPWGRLGDLYGRKFVLITSLSLSAVFSILFGVSQSYTMALLWRFLLGLTNGIVGTVKTVVSEISPSKQSETKMMGKVVGMRAFGFLMSPAIGGFLVSPIKQYPSRFGDTSSWCFHVLSKFPYILPSVVGSAMSIAAALTVRWYIPETLQQDSHPVEFPGPCEVAQDASSFCSRVYVSIKTQLYFWTRHDHAGPTREDCEPHGGESEGTSLLMPLRSSTLGDEGVLSNRVDQDYGTLQVTMRSIWANKLARDCLIPYWIFSLAVSSLDEAFPLFCIASTRAGGLGLSQIHIGGVLSLSGLLFVAFQYMVYAWTIERVGIANSLAFGCLSSFPPASCYVATNQI